MNIYRVRNMCSLRCLIIDPSVVIKCNIRNVTYPLGDLKKELEGGTYKEHILRGLRYLGESKKFAMYEEGKGELNKVATLIYRTCSKPLEMVGGDIHGKALLVDLEGETNQHTTELLYYEAGAKLKIFHDPFLERQRKEYASLLEIADEHYGAVLLSTLRDKLIFDMNRSA